MSKKIFDYGALAAIWTLVLVTAFALLSNSTGPTEEELEIHKKEMVEPIPILIPESISIIESNIDDELPAQPNYRRRGLFRWRIVK